MHLLGFRDMGHVAIRVSCRSLEYKTKQNKTNIDPCQNSTGPCSLALMDSRELFDHIVFPGGLPPPLATPAMSVDAQPDSDVGPVRVFLVDQQAALV